MMVQPGVCADMCSCERLTAITGEKTFFMPRLAVCKLHLALAGPLSMNKILLHTMSSQQHSSVQSAVQFDFVICE